jgi:Squalene/phytoene synthase
MTRLPLQTSYHCRAALQMPSAYARLGCRIIAWRCCFILHTCHVADLCVASACSFAIVIQQLPQQLRDPVCVFYLVLRALDTVEDDMAVPQDVKVPLLRAFHEKCYDRCSSSARCSPLRGLASGCCCMLHAVHVC